MNFELKDVLFPTLLACCLIVNLIVELKNVLFPTQLACCLINNHESN